MTADEMLEQLIALLPVTAEHFKYQAQVVIHRGQPWEGRDEVGGTIGFNPTVYAQSNQDSVIAELAMLMRADWVYRTRLSLRGWAQAVVLMLQAQAPAASPARRPPGTPVPLTAANSRVATAVEQTGCRRGYLHDTASPGNPCPLCGDTGTNLMDPNLRVPLDT